MLNRTRKDKNEQLRDFLRPHDEATQYSQAAAATRVLREPHMYNFGAQWSEWCSKGARVTLEASCSIQ
jgi:hypothetical protein